MMCSSRFTTSKDYVIRGLPIPEMQLPGRFVMRMSEETRELLKQLTSDDAAKCRWPAWIDEPRKEPVPTRNRKRVYSFRK